VVSTSFILGIKEVGRMSTYEAISLMIAFGTLVAIILGTKKITTQPTKT